MHSYLFGHVSFAPILLFFFYALMLRASTVDTDELEHLLLDTILQCMTNAHLTMKESAHYQRIDESQLRKQLRGEPSQHISLTRLLRMPFSFWLHFAPALIQIVYRKRMEEFAQTANDLKRGA
jgi:hypothetical protein